MASKAVSIAVIGGGIGGLAAALSLLREGFDVHVYEQVPVKREVGAGFVLTPNATRLLYRFGLTEKVQAIGVAIDAFRQRRWQDGRTLMCAPVGSRPVNAPMTYTSHRADVLSVLTEALPASACMPVTGCPLSRSRRPCRACNSPTARVRKPTSSSAPTASIPPCAALLFGAGEAALHRLRRLSWAGADRAARLISTCLSSRSFGSGRARISCTTPCMRETC